MDRISNIRALGLNISMIPENSIEDILLKRILYIGESIPDSVANDNRPKTVLLGYPKDIIDSIEELGLKDKMEHERRKKYLQEMIDAINERSRLDKYLSDLLQKRGRV